MKPQLVRFILEYSLKRNIIFSLTLSPSLTYVSTANFPFVFFPFFSFIIFPWEPKGDKYSYQLKKLQWGNLTIITKEGYTYNAIFFFLISSKKIIRRGTNEVPPMY